MTVRVRLAGLTDFGGWRAAARALAVSGVPPEDVIWFVAGDDDLLSGDDRLPDVAPDAAFTAPRAFLHLAATAILHRDSERFALLYRLLWRLRQEPQLLDLAVDPLVARVGGMAKSVRRDEHKMHAFVRFRSIATEEGERFVAWFEPEHFIVELAAPFFARRFASMVWSILTPDRCAHWDGAQLLFTPGETRAAAPGDDALEDVWRAYYCSIFNPARLKVNAMRAEMPKKYWRNLPEARLIKPLIERAVRATSDMIAAPAPEPRRRQRLAAPAQSGPDQMADLLAGSLDELRAEAADCRACPLWAPATQTVFGEGPQRAEVVFVGEQPGDKEDIAGRPFVGPAGQLLDRALVEAGVERKKTYVTNAVKHFKFEPRGKFRLHKKPVTSEIKACHQWLERELALIQPKIVVALGATAVQAVFGRAMPIGANRGRFIDLDAGMRGFITVHPSYLLRVQDEDREAEYGRFLDDLRQIAKAMRR